MPNTRATYVYCLVAAARRPVIRRPRAGVSAAGAIRLLELDGAPAKARADRLKRWLVVADVPLTQYGEQAINTRLNDLDWVSRVAVAHEQVVESFRASDALLPMKLFTIFANDDRATAELQGRRREIDRVLQRVRHHDEWGLRVVLNRDAARRGKGEHASPRVPSGTAYLTRKKAARDRAMELAERSRDVAAAVFDTLAARATNARRRSAADLPEGGATLVLDAAFLVKRSSLARFRAAAAREARALARDGYQLTLTGPWPAYSFMQE